MVKDLTIMLKNQPRRLSQISALLGRMGINIEGIAGTQAPDKDVLHILVKEPEEARELLEKEGIHATVRDVLLVDVEDRPGALGEIAQKLADAGVNINLVYLTTRSELILGVDHFEKARDHLKIS